MSISARISAMTQPNSRIEIVQRVATHQVTWTWPLVMLAIRTALFALWQAFIAGIYALQGHPTPWEASIPWWTVNATLANLVCIALLVWLTQREGFHLLNLYKGDRRYIVRDLLTCVCFFVVSAPVVMVPNILLGNLLFGDVAQTSAIMFRPLPVTVAVINLVLFPATIALAELPTYYGYVMPRLEALSGRTWLAVLVPVLLHAAQHATLPLVFDARFILWRFGMFLPFALMVAIVLRWRPRLLPYMMVGHALLDLQVGVMMLTASL